MGNIFKKWRDDVFLFGWFFRTGIFDEGVLMFFEVSLLVSEFQFASAKLYSDLIG